jgi:hypothetical protein
MHLLFRVAAIANKVAPAIVTDMVVRHWTNQDFLVTINRGTRWAQAEGGRTGMRMDMRMSMRVKRKGGRRSTRRRRRARRGNAGIMAMNEVVPSGLDPMVVLMRNKNRHEKPVEC